MVYIYSASYFMQVALGHICAPENKNKVNYIVNVGDVNISADEDSADYIIMDMPPRLAVPWVYNIRCQYPALPIIFTQRSFLFSDRIVAEYFGSLWLLGYDAALSAYPLETPLALIADNAFSGPYCAGVMRDQGAIASISEGSLKERLNALLRARLTGVISSSRIREVVMDWLVQGFTPGETSRQIKISDKVVYTYRRIAMKAIGAGSITRDFISSLKI